MKNVRSVVLAILMTGMLFGCSEFTNPVDSTRDAQIGSAQKSAIPLPILQSLPKPILGRQRLVSTTARVTVANGGILELSYSYWSILGKCVRSASLTIPPGAVNRDMDITMSFDTSVVGVRFSPEGLVFNTPALFDFDSRGLNLYNLIPGTTFNLFFDNELGIYEIEIANKLTTKLLLGSIGCTQARIPHFSRYAFGR